MISESDGEFIRVCSLSELHSVGGKRIVLEDDQEVAIFKVDGELFAVGNICPHQHAPVIYDGYVEDCTVACPLHGWTYDLRTGAPIIGGARLRTFTVRAEGNDVMLEKPAPTRPAWMR